MLLFSLGRLQFRCVLVDAGQRFTMFLRDGTPVRSHHVGAAAGVRRGRASRSRQGVFFGSPTVSAAVNTRSGRDAVGGVVRRGHRALIAARRHAQRPGRRPTSAIPARWREIADANGIVDPLDLGAGRSLVIPPAMGRARGGRR